MKALRVTWELQEYALDKKIKKQISNHYGKIFLKRFYRSISDVAKPKLSSYYKRKLKSEAKNRAEESSVKLFGRGLKSLLLTKPVEVQKSVLAVDPGFSNGCKCAIVNRTGEVLDTFVVNLRNSSQMKKTLSQKVEKFKVDKICVGDGCGNHEAEVIISDVVLETQNTTFCRIRESGASVYSCSEIGEKDLPGRSPAERGAITLARRIVNPLQEFVKVDPKSLGVGQYQHDLSPKQLDAELDQILEEVVSYIGVDVNVADEYLLARIAGLNKTRAKAIVDYRNKGLITDLNQLTKIKGLGPKSFKQCAGFLRVFPETARHKSKSLPDYYDITNCSSQSLQFHFDSPGSLPSC